MNKIYMYPGRSPQMRNRYIDLLVEALSALAVKADHWHPLNPFVTRELFHIHWPEVFFHRRNTVVDRCVKTVILRNFWHTINTVKRNDGKIVWTVHNICPHCGALSNSDEWRQFMNQFTDAIDSYILLTPGAHDTILDTYPHLKHKRYGVAHHPHYRSIMPKISGRDWRSVLGISHDSIVFGMIGSLRFSKGVYEVLQSYEKLNSEQTTLLLAGHCDDKVEKYCSELMDRGFNIKTLLRPMSDQEIVDLHAVLDMMVFPSSQLNSGSIFQALSQDKPVRVYPSESNKYLSNFIGSKWFSFIEGDIFNADLVESLLIQRRAEISKCDLSLFESSYVARQHVEIYGF